jgi:hypothetical protein
MNLQTRSAWKERVLDLLEKGTPLTETLARCRVGKSMLYQELRRDQDFLKRYNDLNAKDNS